jgi:hypothetical protein
VDAVRFAFGDRPQIDDSYVNDLAESLSGRRNLDADLVVGKLEVELRKPHEERSDIRLTARELEQLIDVLAEDLPKLPRDRPEPMHLLAEARAAYARGEWAQDSS